MVRSSTRPRKAVSYAEPKQFAVDDEGGIVDDTRGSRSNPTSKAKATKFNKSKAGPGPRLLTAAKPLPDRPPSKAPSQPPSTQTKNAKLASHSSILNSQSQTSSPPTVPITRSSSKHTQSCAVANHLVNGSLGAENQGVDSEDDEEGGGSEEDEEDEEIGKDGEGPAAEFDFVGIDSDENHESSPSKIKYILTNSQVLPLANVKNTKRPASKTPHNIPSIDDISHNTAPDPAPTDLSSSPRPIPLRKGRRRTVAVESESDDDLLPVTSKAIYHKAAEKNVADELRDESDEDSNDFMQVDEDGDGDQMDEDGDEMDEDGDGDEMDEDEAYSGYRMEIDADADGADEDEEEAERMDLDGEEAEELDLDDFVGKNVAERAESSRYEKNGKRIRSASLGQSETEMSPPKQKKRKTVAGNGTSSPNPLPTPVANNPVLVPGHPDHQVNQLHVRKNGNPHPCLLTRVNTFYTPVVPAPFLNEWATDQLTRPPDNQSDRAPGDVPQDWIRDGLVNIDLVSEPKGMHEDKRLKMDKRKRKKVIGDYPMQEDEDTIVPLDFAQHYLAGLFITAKTQLPQEQTSTLGKIDWMVQVSYQAWTSPPVFRITARIAASAERGCLCEGQEGIVVNVIDRRQNAPSYFSLTQRSLAKSAILALIDTAETGTYTSGSAINLDSLPNAIMVVVGDSLSLDSSMLVVGKVEYITPLQLDNASPSPPNKSPIKSSTLTATQTETTSSTTPTTPKSMSTPQPRGLVNVGNTCFMNAALQIICHTRGIESAVQSALKDRPEKLEMQATRDLQDLLASMAVPGSAVKPGTFVKQLKVYCPDMALGLQQDSHEFLSGLIATLKEQQTIRREDAWGTDNETWVDKIWGGRMTQSIRCKRCSGDFISSDRFLQLQLDIAFPGMSIGQGIANLSHPQDLVQDNRYACERCNNLTDAVRVDSIVDYPPVMTLVIKRFDALGRKVGGAVDVPSALHFPAQPGVAATSYSLRGAILHQGSSSTSGHYTANVRIGDSSWWHLDDAFASQCPTGISEQEATAVYIVCYEQLDYGTSRSVSSRRAVDTVDDESVKDVTNDLDMILDDFYSADNVQAALDKCNAELESLKEEKAAVESKIAAVEKAKSALLHGI